jgi:hypothetical protein
MNLAENHQVPDWLIGKAPIFFLPKSTEFPAPVSATVANARCDATGATCAQEWAPAPGDGSHGPLFYFWVIIWVCLKMLCTPLYPIVLLIIIPIKWLVHWEYTLFSDKPIWIYG